LFLKKKYQNLNLLEVSSSALKNNYSYFQSLHPNQKICPVLKSNAYGHDLKLVAKFLDKKIHPPFVCVDSLYEAYELQKAKVKTPILIIGYTFPKNFVIQKKLPFSFPVYDEKTLFTLVKYQPHAPIHLKIDSGMNRLGLQEKDIPSFIKILKKCPRANIQGIYTHLSQADDPSQNSFTKKQVKTFKSIIKQFKSAGFSFLYQHISATAGVFLVNDPEFNLIRLGLGFYGLSPFIPNSASDRKLKKHLKPALKFTTHLIQTKDIKKGQKVSYSGIFTAPKDLKIAILPVGYNDGLNYALSNRGVVTIKNTPCPILGKICMNLTIINISNIKNPYLGQKVTIYSSFPNSPNSIANSAHTARTIPYILLTSLHPSTKRILV
jgi:alanine racemase